MMEVLNWPRLLFKTDIESINEFETVDRVEDHVLTKDALKNNGRGTKALRVAVEKVFGARRGAALPVAQAAQRAGAR